MELIRTNTSAARGNRWSVKTLHTALTHAGVVRWWWSVVCGLQLRAPKPDQFVRPDSGARPPRTWTILRHDGPNHLGLWCDALPRASNGRNHLGFLRPQVCTEQSLSYTDQVLPPAPPPAPRVRLQLQ